METDISIIDERKIRELLLDKQVASPANIREILAKSAELRGLSLAEVAGLMRIEDPDLLVELFAAARHVKDEIYGDRLVIFAPLYVSNRCGNECSYCAFRAGNRALERRHLSRREIEDETRILVEQGHKRVLLVSGENGSGDNLSYILEAIEAVYSVRHGNGEIRRINVNIAPLETDQFRRLRQSGIGTYQLFQETYHRPTYQAVHTAGRKRDFDWRLSVMDRAMEAGIDDVGIGVLFGLYDWRYDVLAMLQHIRHLEQRFGVGPHTISVPRMEPAVGSPLAAQPPHPVSDRDFLKLIAILRLAVPYTGIIMSTRESAEMRRTTFDVGVSQISAGSCTDPGGYARGQDDAPAGQFQVGDLRPLDEVVRDVASMGFIPSFCTACYRLQRTGADFMDLAKPGEIKLHCAPNALSTFQEYLEDYASEETRNVGRQLIATKLLEMGADRQSMTRRMIENVTSGKRDVFI